MSRAARSVAAGWVAIAALSFSGCSRRESSRAAPTSSGQFSSRAGPPAAGSSSSDRAPSAAPSAPRPAASSSTAASSLPIRAFDAGTNACRLVYGPIRQAFLGDVAMAPTDTGVLLVTHHDGVPTVTRVDSVDAAPLAADSPNAIDVAGLPVASFPPCVIAGAFSFCMDGGGAIHRRSLETEGKDVVVARARAGSVFAAELVAAAHVVVAYLAERQTSVGVMSEAYAVLDDGPPLRLSDEGSGATHVSLASRAGSLLALLIDGRTAMTPVHGRSLTIAGGRLVAREDVVVFVGGGAEANTRGALGVSASGAAFALVPIAGEASFGLAAIKLDDPPRLDEPTTWSAYLNGLDPAPVVATRGTTPIRVGRVRPLEARADSPRGLELGKLDEAGTFVPYGLVSSKGRVRSPALAVDRAGMLWLAFTDGAGTWLERRACP